MSLRNPDAWRPRGGSARPQFQSNHLADEMALPSLGQPTRNFLPPRRRLARGWSRPACLLLAALWLAPAAAQTPLYEQPPFDRITLDAANDAW